MVEQCPIFVIGSFVAACSVEVSRFPTAGETLRASSFTLEAGGKGFNCAVALHRLGSRVDGLLMTGDDLLAALAREALAREGLPPSLLLSTPGQTGAGVGFVRPDGENIIAVHAGANDRLARAHVAAADARIAAATMIVGQFEVGDEPLIAAFERARGALITTVLCPSPYRPIDPGLLRNTDIIVLNAVEADALAAAIHLEDRTSDAGDFQRLASRLIAMGIDMVVITAGPKGASAWLHDGRQFDQPAFDVVAVDAIGAGDAFLAGFCSALNEGMDAETALRRGAACGALVASRRGVLDALPSSRDVAAFVAGRA